jgi:hypothetical protein
MVIYLLIYVRFLCGSLYKQGAVQYLARLGTMKTIMIKSGVKTVSHVKDRNLWDALDFILGDARRENAAISLRKEIEEKGLMVEYQDKGDRRVIAIAESGGVEWLKYTTWTGHKTQEANKNLYELNARLGYLSRGRLHALKYSLSYTDEASYGRVEVILKMILSDSVYYGRS